jgi:hypothetical protein
MMTQPELNPQRMMDDQKELHSLTGNAWPGQKPGIGRVPGCVKNWPGCLDKNKLQHGIII